MKQTHCQLHLLALLLLPLVSTAQTFNHLYPSGGGRPVILAEPANGGYRMIAQDGLTYDSDTFVNIQTDTMGVQTDTDTVQVDFNLAGDFQFQRLSDGNFTFTFGNYDLTLVKGKEDGTVLWFHEYELGNFYADILPGKVVEGNNGELFVYGDMRPFFFAVEGRFYIIKANSNGDELWVKSFSADANPDTYDPNVEGATATADGGFLMVGTSYQGLYKYLFHFEADGDSSLVVTKVANKDSRSLVVEGSPGKAVFSYSNGTATSNSAAMLEQYDVASGVLDWQLQLEPFDTPTFPQQSFITALSKTNDGNYLVAGHASATGQTARFFLAKVNSMGQVVWSQHDYGFTAEATFIRETDTGGILVAGQCYGFTWLMLTDSLGHLDCPTFHTSISTGICEGETYNFNGQSLTGAGTYTQLFQSQSPCDSIVTLTLAIHPLETIHYYESLCLGEVSYLTGNQYFQTGIFVEDTTYQSQFGCDSTAVYHIEVDSTIFIEGWATVPYGEVFLGQIITQSGLYGSVDTSEYGCITIASFEVYVINSAASDKLSEQINLVVSPNPFCDEVQIRFKLPVSATVSASIFNAQGRRAVTLFADEKLPSGEHQLSSQTSDWPPGIYFLQFMVNGETCSRRLVKVCK